MLAPPTLRREVGYCVLSVKSGPRKSQMRSWEKTAKKTARMCYHTVTAASDYCDLDLKIHTAWATVQDSATTNCKSFNFLIFFYINVNIDFWFSCWSINLIQDYPMSATHICSFCKTAKKKVFFFFQMNVFVRQTNLKENTIIFQTIHVWSPEIVHRIDVSGRLSVTVGAAMSLRTL